LHQLFKQMCKHGGPAAEGLYTLFCVTLPGNFNEGEKCYLLHVRSLHHERRTIKDGRVTTSEVTRLPEHDHMSWLII
jgi:hypothetical protein